MGQTGDSFNDVITNLLEFHTRNAVRAPIFNQVSKQKNYQIYDGFGNKTEIRFEPKPCKKGCGALVTFDPTIRNQNGRLIPLNADHSNHQCSSRSERI